MILPIAIAGNPTIARESTPLYQKTQKVALSALSDLVIAMTISAICFPFVSCSLASLQIICVAVRSIFFNTVVTGLTKPFFEKSFEGRLFAQSTLGISFYRFIASNAVTLVHETGHFTVAKLLLKGPAHIHIQPFVGGWTSYFAKTPTALGAKIGLRNAIFLITLAGPSLTVLASSVALIAGILLYRLHPDGGSYLIGTGLMSLLSQARYAYSAMAANPRDNTHDFVRLRSFGIPPVWATLSIMALSVTLIAGSLWLQNRKK